MRRALLCPLRSRSRARYAGTGDGYQQSSHWLSDLCVGQEGLSDATRLQRIGLIESLLPENGEKPFAVLSRKVIKDEMRARTPSQAGNLLSALRGMFRWMIDEGHLDEDDDPTIGLKSGKTKASRESGGFVPWTEEDMAMYRAKWPLGTEARMMFDILQYMFLRVGNAHGFGPPHLRKMAVQITTEKSKGNTTVTVPVHPEFTESLPAARAAGIIARTSSPTRRCLADCTESQMMAMFGWTDPKMPAHYIAKGKPGEARDEPHGQDRRARSEPVAR